MGNDPEFRRHAPSPSNLGSPGRATWLLCLITGLIFKIFSRYWSAFKNWEKFKVTGRKIMFISNTLQVFVLFLLIPPLRLGQQWDRLQWSSSRESTGVCPSRQSACGTERPPAQELGEEAALHAQPGWRTSVGPLDLKILRAASVLAVKWLHQICKGTYPLKWHKSAKILKRASCLRQWEQCQQCPLSVTSYKGLVNVLTRNTWVSVFHYFWLLSFEWPNSLFLNIVWHCSYEIHSILMFL